MCHCPLPVDSGHAPKARAGTSPTPVTTVVQDKPAGQKGTFNNPKTDFRMHTERTSVPVSSPRPHLWNRIGLRRGVCGFCFSKVTETGQGHRQPSAQSPG